MKQPTIASFSLSRKQKAVACAVGIIPVTFAGFGLIKCGCARAAWIIEITIAVAYFLWIAL
jgi:hypothetical protein